jgi:tetratricopeptide (TPR) repeat protein
MNTRIPMGISIASVAALTAVLAVAAPAHGAVTVFGGGVARDCYEAVEYERLPGLEALNVCTLAIEQEQLTRRNRAATYVNRGILHMRLGDNESALRDYERSLQLLPDLVEAKVNLGAALYGLQRFDEAMTALNEGVASENSDARATAHYNRALIHERRGDVQAAYDDFRTALEIEPSFEQAARQLTRFTVVGPES